MIKDLKKGLRDVTHEPKGTLCLFWFLSATWRDATAPFRPPPTPPQVFWSLTTLWIQTQKQQITLKHTTVSKERSQTEHKWRLTTGGHRHPETCQKRTATLARQQNQEINSLRHTSIRTLVSLFSLSQYASTRTPNSAANISLPLDKQRFHFLSVSYRFAEWNDIPAQWQLRNWRLTSGFNSRLELHNAFVLVCERKRDSFAGVTARWCWQIYRHMIKRRQLLRWPWGGNKEIASKQFATSLRLHIIKVHNY